MSLKKQIWGLCKNSLNTIYSNFDKMLLLKWFGNRKLSPRRSQAMNINGRCNWQVRLVSTFRPFPSTTAQMWLWSQWGGRLTMINFTNFRVETSLNTVFPTLFSHFIFISINVLCWGMEVNQVYSQDFILEHMLHKVLLFRYLTHNVSCQGAVK